MKKRLFIATNLAPELEKQLGYLLDQLRDFSYLKTADKNQLHLTLAFLGDTDETKMPTITNILNKLSREETSITLEPLPPELISPPLHSPRRPSRSPWPVEAPGRSRLGEGWRGIWLAIKPNPALIQLADNLRARLNSAGFPLDPKPFNGHITLARSKTDRLSPELQQWLSDWANTNLPTSPVSEIILYSSQLTPTGPLHTPEFSVKVS